MLTTQYLEEADRLADDIVVLDHGRVAAHGTPAELKAQVGGERVEVTLDHADELPAAAEALEPFADGPVTRDTDALSVTAPLPATTRLMEIVRALDGAGVDALDVSRRQATLDDVFLSLTATPEEVPA